MKTISKIKDEAQDKASALFKECRVFFAYSDEQFIQGCKENRLQEGEKYVRFTAGGFLPNSQTEKLIDGLESIDQWKNTEIKKMKDGKREHIKYELANYECYLTGNIDDVVEILPYPRKDIMKVFIEERKNYSNY